MQIPQIVIGPTRPRRICTWCSQALMDIRSSHETGVVVCDRCDGPEPGWMERAKRIARGERR